MLKKRERVICIAGFDELNREWVNQQEAAVEIWTVNEGAAFFSRVDRVFQMHPRNWRDEERKLKNHGELPSGRNPGCFGRNRDYLAHLRTLTIPIYCQRRWGDIPHSVRYPFEDVQAVVGVPAPPTDRTRLFITDSFAYMLALAIYEHRTGSRIAEIRLAGIELYDGREARWELPCVLFYIGMAMGNGVRIALPPQGTSLLNAPLYGIEGPYPGTVDSENLPEHNVAQRSPCLILDPVTGMYRLMPPVTPEPLSTTEYIFKPVSADGAGVNTHA